MTLNEQRAACARFMGYTVSGDMWADQDVDRVWLIDGDRELAYRPDEYTPEGKYQADGIWKQLDNQKYHLLFFDNGRCVQIQDGQTRDESKYFVEGNGKWWNSALTAAAAQLQMEIEKR